VSIAIEVDEISKGFPGVVANDRISLQVRSGEIHAVCGENGAGKSTLMKILYGMLPPDSGRVLVDGEEVRFRSPSDAIARGIGMVHQHFMLADQLTVLENVILGDEPLRGLGRIDFEQARTHLSEVARDYGLEVDPDDLAETLSVGERQRVEIIKVLYRGARILILDEPTSVLVPQEVEELFRNLRDLRDAGSTILFIDHKLEEVLAIADTITVLRQGRSVATVKPDEVTAADLAELMVGSELPVPETTTSTVTDIVALALRNVTVLDDAEREVVRDVTFEVRRGEIFGIAGIEGNGQAELIDALVGTMPVAAGTISLIDQDVTHWGVRRRREHGLAYIPQDRHREGLLLQAPLWENTALGHQTRAPFVRGLWFDRAGARRRTREVVDSFDVRTPSIEVTSHALSGGNQQKLIVGREMAADPAVLIAGHPTRGIDVGAQAAVWKELRRARAAGMATVLVSADLEELIGLSDTLVVMLRGRIVAHLDPETVTPRDLGSYMTGAALGAPEA
jgi:general nucleoside transport system ATP-binding protein